MASPASVSHAGVTDRDTPKGWRIDSDFWPFPASTATHADYDASYEGEEDGWVDNGLIATGKTRAEVLAEIDRIARDTLAQPGAPS